MGYILPLLFLLWSGDVSNDSVTVLNFDIVRNERVIGSLEANRTVSGTNTYYKSFTEINTGFIVRIKVDHKYDVVFNGGQLRQADVRITVNDKLHAKTITKWKNSSYLIAENTVEVTTFTDLINHATILLYFEEPISISSSYSEQEASFNSIVPLGNHTYKKTNTMGRENIYHYEKGVLKKIEVDGGLISFEMIAHD